MPETSSPTGSTGPTSNLPAVTAAVTLPKDFGIPQMAALARDLAVEFKDVPTILTEHGLTQQQYDHLKTVPYFDRVLKQAVEDWNKPGSTRERIALQAQFLLERSLPTMGSRLEVGTEALGNVIEGIKTLADLGGVTNQPQQAQAQEKFIINIDLGGDRQVFETARPVIVDAQATGLLAVQSLPEGDGAAEPVRKDPVASREQPELQHEPAGPGTAPTV